jgi:hypothetical protein
MTKSLEVFLSSDSTYTTMEWCARSKTIAKQFEVSMLRLYSQRQPEKSNGVKARLGSKGWIGNAQICIQLTLKRQS